MKGQVLAVDFEKRELKDTQRQNEKLNDVIDLRSSFISKHSKEQ